MSARSAGAGNIRGLYAITPETTDSVALASRVGQALAGGARVVQYRFKGNDASLAREQGRALVALCRAAAVPLIVNDDLALALAIGADGLHLGRDDGDIAAARRALGPGRLLGASCYDRIELAAQALAAGADHVAFGSVFVSPTKPGAVRAPLAIFGEARTRFGVPVVAIGGITPDNARAVIDAGADAVAVISALFEAPDIEAAGRRFASCFKEPS